MNHHRFLIYVSTTSQYSHGPEMISVSVSSETCWFGHMDVSLCPNHIHCHLVQVWWSTSLVQFVPIGPLKTTLKRHESPWMCVWFVGLYFMRSGVMRNLISEIWSLIFSLVCEQKDTCPIGVDVCFSLRCYVCPVNQSFHPVSQL